jgi:GT2 family glycosyltransferase
MLSVDEAPLLEHSLPAALAQPDADVVVVDNACTDRTRSLCEALGAQVVPLRERRSYAAAMNAGLARTSGDAVLLLNADCVLTEGFLEMLARPLEERPDVGSVAPRLVRATGVTPQTRLDVLDTAAMTIDRRRKNLLVGHGDPVGSRAQSGPCFGGDGACVLYRREVLEAVAVGAEVFDEDLALWASDVDVAWRAQRLGWGAWYEPGAVAFHKRFYSPTTRRETAAEHRRLQFRNRLLMLVKNDDWRSVLRDAPWILTYEVLALGHALLRERELLPGYVEFLRLLPGARARRRASPPASARPPFGLRPAAASS